MVDNETISLEEQLWQAAREGDAAKIRQLVLRGADIDARTPEGWTALNLAAKNGSGAAMRTLIAAREMQAQLAAGVDLREELEAREKQAPVWSSRKRKNG